MNTNRRTLWLAAAILFSSMTVGRCEEQATRTPPVTLPAEAVRSLNAQPMSNRPKDAEAPSKFSVDHATHAAAYNFQAPGIVIVPLPDGRVRVWLSWYQQNNKPGGGAIGQGSIPHCV